jgi:hypothetical protein
MPHENVETVNRAFERWNRGDREVLADDVDRELELHSRMLGGVVRGPDGLRSWFLEIDQQFKEWRAQIAEVREVGRGFSCSGRFTCEVVRARWSSISRWPG